MNPSRRRHALTFLILTASLTLQPASTPAQIEGLVPTKTSVEVSRGTSNVGQPVAITAIVTALGPDPGVPAGAVEFFSGNDSLGTASIRMLEDKATASLDVTLPAGIHPLIARYQGNATFAFSLSAPPVPHEVLPESSSQ